MLQFLQTGKVLYVLAAICGLGIVSKLVTSSLYKRLIKETENMVLTKNKNLRLLKQKTENLFLISRNLHNTNAYIEKQLYSFRFMNLSLDSWDNVAVQAMILCILVGGLAAFGTYWYRVDSYYIVLYGTMGILSGLLLVLVDNSVNISLKRQQLADCLVDYMENSPHFSRPMEKSSSSEPVERRVSNTKSNAETSSKHVSILSMKKERKKPTVRQTAMDKLSKNSGSFGKMDLEPVDDMQKKEDELRKSIDGLKQSLEQIAVAREETQKGTQVVKAAEDRGQVRKELSPENIKFLEEILQEYFS